MVKIQYIGQHQAKDIIEVNDIKAKELVETGNYIYLNETIEKIERETTEPIKEEVLEEINEE